MSKITARIKELQLKQKKIDYVSYIADLIKNDTKCHDFADVKNEVLEKIEPFLLTLIDAIEGDTEIQNESKDALTSEETAVLKAVAQKIMTKPTVKDVQVPAVANGAFNQDAPQPPPPKKQELNPSDKMNFAMSNRHLANKRVQVINDQNVQILGNVVGLDAPFVIVKTDTGPTIQVPLEKVVLQ